MNKAKRRNIIIGFLQCCLILGIAMIQYYQFQFVTIGSTSKVVQQQIPFVILNVSMILFVYLLISIFVKKWTIILAVTSVVGTGWSIAHHYVVIFHGGPLFFSVLANAGAALNVAGAYTYTIDVMVKRLLVCLVIQAVGIILYHFLSRLSTYNAVNWRKSRIIIALINLIYLYICLFSSFAIRPEQMIKFSWEYSIREYGYLVCILEDFENTLNPFVTPEGYDSGAITVEPSNEEIGKIKTPDIILILNETFYDLSLYTDINPSTDYLSGFYHKENAIYGYAMVPSVGGGTNNSEYELLTSNSMMLLHNEAPFNYIDLSKTNTNVVQYLETFGYTTYGFHGAEENNYSRKRAYPELGFDNSILGWDSSEFQIYGNRRRLDEDDYKNLIENYENDEKSPKFMYLLTYQNHGGWEQNEESYDTVFTQNDYGQLTDDINEYLTSMLLSAEAFNELTEYYANCGKPTIICMVGDHAPSFVNQLPTNLTSEEQNLYSKLVPYIIWSNYEVEYPEYTEYISLTDLVPMVAETVGFPLTAYYKNILELQKEIPVRTSQGKYYNSELKEVNVLEESLIGDLLEQYYFMEYNTLKAGEEYKTELFTPFYK